MLDFIRGKAQSLIVKIIFAIIILVFVFWGVGGLGGSVVSVVVTVNDTSITEQEFRQQYGQTVQALEAQSPDTVKEMIADPAFRQRVLQQMILDILLLDEARRIGLTVTPLELRKSIEAFPVFHNESGTFDAEVYTRVLQAQGQAFGNFEKLLAKDLLLQKLQNQVVAGAYVSNAELKNLYMYNGERRTIEYVLFDQEAERNVTLTPEAIQAYYDAEKNQLFAVPAHIELDLLLIGTENIAKTLTIDEALVEAAYEKNKPSYLVPEQVHARHIILLFDENTNPEKEAVIKKRIDDLAARIKKGESFEALAKAHSEDASAPNGGDLGYFSQAEMVEPFAVAAFNLQDGAISEPVRSQYGYHLIKREGYKPATTRPYKEIAPTLRNQLVQNEAAAQVQTVLDQFLLAVIAGKSMEDAAKDIGLSIESIKRTPVQAFATTWKLKLEQLDAIMSAPVGKVIETPLVTSQGYLIVRPKRTEPASVQPLAEVTSIIEATLRREKALQNAASKAEATLAEMRKVPAADGKLTLPTTLTSKTKQVTIGRDGIIGTLGANSELMKAVFATDLNVWLPATFVTNEGNIIAQVVKTALPTDEQWKAVQGLLEGAVLKAQEDQLFQAFINMLFAKAEIEEHNQNIVN